MEQYFSYNFLEVLNISIYIIAPRTCTVYPILSPYWFYPSKLEVKIVGPKDAVEISWDCPARLKLMAYGINSMKYELWREKFSEKYPNQAWSVILKNLTLALGTQCDRDPKSWVAGLLEQTGRTGTKLCFQERKWWVLYPPLDLSIPI